MLDVPGYALGVGGAGQVAVGHVQLEHVRQRSRPQLGGARIGREDEDPHPLVPYLHSRERLASCFRAQRFESKPTGGFPPAFISLLWVRVCLMIEGQEGVTWDQWQAIAATAEANGFDAL